MTESNANTIRLHRVVHAPPERVYRAFLDANAMVKWLPPMDSRARFITSTQKSEALPEFRVPSSVVHGATALVACIYRNLPQAKPPEHWLRPVHHKPIGAVLIHSLMERSGLHPLDYVLCTL